MKNLYIILSLFIFFGILSINAIGNECEHAICPGNFECPKEYYFYKRKGSCCYDCVNSCKNLECPKTLTCNSTPNDHIVKAGNRFCCDHCYINP